MFVDGETPSSGEVFHYLVHSIAPNVGSFGENYAGERPVVCAP